MTKHDKVCILMIWVAWAVLMSFIFFGCAKPVQAKANELPFAESIGRNLNLTDCKQADDLIIKLHGRREELIRLQNGSMGTQEFRESLSPQIEAIPYWILQIHYWMTDNCAEA